MYPIQPLSSHKLKGVDHSGHSAHEVPNPTPAEPSLQSPHHCGSPFPHPHKPDADKNQVFEVWNFSQASMKKIEEARQLRLRIPSNSLFSTFFI